MSRYGLIPGRRADNRQPADPVFDVTRIEEADYDQLSWVSRLKTRVHGMNTAYTPRADQCLACGLCVMACPDGAIRLAEAI